MDRTFLATVVATVVLLGAGLAAGLYIGGTGTFDERQRVDAEVTGFFVGNVTCEIEPNTTPAVDVGNTTRGSFLTLEVNVTARDSRLPVNATIDETALAQYNLSYAPGGSAPDCAAGESAVVPTRVDFQVPHPGREPFGVTVRYGNETLLIIENGNEPGVVVEDL